ncbi:glycosyltransferase family 2 protein [Thermophagus sp. OGC60D27]|uniref:glycosyltransferase family 2 protein n=1 Tax=Thermophagus sp. OGC60D27 TaxID=3458415 RepID=UPI00403832FE
MNKINLPKVTIVTPSYNQAEFLEETILSVLNQTYPNIEYIVVDGGSTDGSVDIIKKYEDRLAWWVSEPDNGQSDAINKGFAHATGEIYNWLNSDDILYAETVSIAVHFMQKYPNYELVYGDRVVIDNKGRIVDVFEPVAVSRRMARFALRIPQETTFFTSRIWHKVGGLNESLHFVMDSDLWYRFLDETRFFHIPVFMGAYRNHEESKSVYGLGKEKSDKAMEEIYYLRKNYSSLLSRISLLRKMVRYFNLVRQAYEKNRRTRRLIKEEVKNEIYK